LASATAASKHSTQEENRDSHQTPNIIEDQASPELPQTPVFEQHGCLNTLPPILQSRHHMRSKTISQPHFPEHHPPFMLLT
jgi:hypothetical protein